VENTTEAENMTKRKERRTFDGSFKRQVVQMIKQQGLSIGQVCKDMQLGETAIAWGCRHPKRASSFFTRELR